MEIQNLLDNINIIYKRNKYIITLIKDNSENPVINVYTTGLAYKGFIKRWNKYIDEWLHNILNKHYIVNLQHYDNFPKNSTIKSGKINRKYLEKSEMKEPYFIFDFSHAVVIDYTQNRNSVYIPFNEYEKDPFFEFGLKPFIIDDSGNITTYMTQLLEGDYEIIDRELIIEQQYLKSGKTNVVKYKTLKFQDIIFDYDDNWITVGTKAKYNKYTYLLFRILNHGNFRGDHAYIELNKINEILSQLNLSEFRSSIRDKTTVDADDVYYFTGG